LDADPIEFPKTVTRLRELGFGEDVFIAKRSNYAGLQKVMAEENIPAVDFILADLGVSSMQLDNPERGFSTKLQGPLDMRMNPQRGQSAADFLKKIAPEKLSAILANNSDEPYSGVVAKHLAGKSFSTTKGVTAAILDAVKTKTEEVQDAVLRRVFQAIRIELNEEFNALETLLRILPACLKEGGRVAILTFHSGEDRRVKHAFENGLKNGHYKEVNSEIIRPSAEERYTNPRSASAKLRWARK
jgi:16S rRNA (cytosine1402-N4)-methyltransferase